MVLALLYDKGLFEYDDKITKYWPEFGQNGKEDLKISDVCRHRVGIPHLPIPPSIQDSWTENIKMNKMSELIETVEPKYANLDKFGSKADYHAFTRGWILNEIVRRIDPQQRTMDEILRQEINIDGVHITVNEEEKKRLVSQSSITVGYTLGQSLLPKCAGRRIEPNIITIGKVICECFCMK